MDIVVAGSTSPLEGSARFARWILRTVFASNRELFGRVDAHLDAPARAAQQRDLDWAVGEQLRHGHAHIHTVRRLDEDRFVSAATEDQHKSGPRQRAQRRRESLALRTIN